MDIFFQSEIKNFRFDWEERCRKWLLEVITVEERKLGRLVYNFVSKRRILYLNREFLNHDYFTDVITFDNGYMRVIEGEIFICIYVVRENALESGQEDFRNEQARVIVHGLLHLIGYGDKIIKEKEIMRKKEDEYLRLLEKS